THTFESLVCRLLQDTVGPYRSQTSRRRPGPTVESLFGDVAHLLVRCESAIAVGIRRSVAPLQPDLVHPQASELLAVREKVLVDAQPAVGIRVELGHPRADTVGVELVVPCPVQ